MNSIIKFRKVSFHLLIVFECSIISHFRMKNAFSIIYFLFVLIISFDLLQSAAVRSLDDIPDNHLTNKNGAAIKEKASCCGGCIFGFNPTCGCPCAADVGMCCQYEW